MAPKDADGRTVPLVKMLRGIIRCSHGWASRDPPSVSCRKQAKSYHGREQPNSVGGRRGPGRGFSTIAGWEVVDLFVMEDKEVQQTPSFSAITSRERWWKRTTAGVEEMTSDKRSSKKCPSFPLLRLLLLLLPLGSVFTVVESSCRRPPAIFNFGDSNSDTGGFQAGLGYVIGLPNGRRFPAGPTGRVCDGRLVIDFLCGSLNMKYLSPYLEALGSDFSNGANFAIAGASTMPRNLPFSLLIQVLQFLHFRSRSLQLVAKGSKHLINEKGFQSALYTFDIGHNDLSKLFDAGLSYSQVIEQIPSVLAEIRGAIKMIYNKGGKHFWVHGTGPLGCLPQKLSMYKKDASEVDTCGCLTSFNKASKAFNDGLSSLCDELTTELQNATIVYTDLYVIKYDLIANYTKYGFENPLMACCGYGGPPYNFNMNITCYNSAGQACTDGSKFISWDGVHYSEAANAIVASKILSADYSKPRVKFESFCIA